MSSLLELVLDISDLRYGLDGYWYVPGRREYDLVLELMVLDPWHLVRFQNIAPGVVDAISS